MKIKSNKEIFDKWTNLSIRIRNVNAIVQNDMELDENEVLIHLAEGRRTVKQLEDLIEETADYLFKDK